MMKLYLSSGTPPRTGDYYVKCHLLISPYKPGIKKLSDLASTEQGDSSACEKKCCDNEETFENISVQEQVQAGDIDPVPMEVNCN
jgi:hypothetical protein